MATGPQNGAGGFSAKGFPVGVDLLSAETALPRGALRAAINVDIDRAGKWRRRRGTQLVFAGTDVHSLWAPLTGSTAYFVEGRNLRSCRPADPTAPRPLIRTGLTEGAPMNFCEVNDEIYYSNGLQSGTVFGRFGVEMPIGEIACTAVTRGMLAPGVYKVGLVFVKDTGEESGAIVSYFTLGSKGGIAVSSFQLPQDPAIHRARFFLSATDDEVLYQAADIGFSAGAVEFLEPATGRILETEFMEPPPPAQALCLYNGRLYGALDAIVWYTQALRYGLFRPSTDFIDFGDRVTLLAPAPTGGLYVGTTNGMFFMAGDDPAKFSMEQVSELGPVEGSGVFVETVKLGVKGLPEVLAPMWFTTSGWVLGLSDGVIKNLVHDKLAFSNLGRGSAVVRKVDGDTHVMGVFRGGDGPTQAIASDSMTSEIIRNGVVIKD